MRCKHRKERQAELAEDLRKHKERAEREFPKRKKPISGKMKKEGTPDIYEIDWNYPIQSWEFEDRGSDEEEIAKCPKDLLPQWEGRKKLLFRYANKMKQEKML